jgi:hypothetical protein
MVQNTFITSISSSTTLSPGFDTYLITATGASAIDLTLPVITSDGEVYNLVRLDTSPTGTVNVVTGTGLNLIYQNLGPFGSTGTTGLSLLPQTSSQLQSRGLNWLVTQNDALNRTESKCLFSSSTFGTTGFTASLPAAGSRAVICYFPYRGAVTERISQLEIIARGVGTLTVVFDLRVTAVATNIIQISPPGSISTIRSQFFSNVISNPGFMPQAPSILEIGVTKSVGTGTSVIIDSVVVR